MPETTLSRTEQAVVDWMRANKRRLAKTGDVEPAVLIIGQPIKAEALISCLEDDHQGFQPLGDVGKTTVFPREEIRAWGSMAA